MSTWGQRGVPRTTRTHVLNRDQHTCQLQYPGCQHLATEVDDIIPVSQRGITRAHVTPNDCQAVCQPCHHVKTERERLAAIEHRRTRRKLPKPPHPGV